MKIKFLVLILLVPTLAWSSGTVVRDGGDPLFLFLEATRYSLVETIKLIELDSKEGDTFCRSAQLSQDKISLCKNFFHEVATQILNLNQGTNVIDFVLRDEPLLVQGPDGKDMPVAARTTLDSRGVIEFHRGSIKLSPPSEILSLMAHEFQHKSVFNGHYVTDNEAIGPFRNGRDLLDTVANAITDVAKRTGKVGSQYSMRDNFQCVVDVNGAKVGSFVSPWRLFLGQDMLKYESNISRNRNDVYLYETNDSLLVFRTQISEPANCKDDPQFSPDRRTSLQIARVYINGKAQHPEEILNQSTLPGFNPICIVNGGTIALSYQNVKFSCQYYGTEGVASRMLRRNSPAQKL